MLGLDMRIWLSGPRIFGGLIRPGVSFNAGGLFRARPSAAISQDYVYVIAGEHGLTKVGISRDPSARLATLQTGSPFRLRIAHIAPANGRALEVEREAHAILQNCRQSGEWFLTSPEMAIAAVYAASERAGVSLTAVPGAAASGPRVGPVGAFFITLFLIFGGAKLFELLTR